MPDSLKRDDAGLAERLRSWRVEAEVPADFRRAVWRRIARHPLTLRERCLRYWREPVGRPAQALAGAALALIVAVAAAHQHADRVNASRLRAAERDYVHSISPVLQIGRPTATSALHNHDF